MLIILGNRTEFERVLDLLTKNLNFDKDINVSVFETNIRSKLSLFRYGLVESGLCDLLCFGFYSHRWTFVSSFAFVSTLSQRQRCPLRRSKALGPQVALRRASASASRNSGEQGSACFRHCHWNALWHCQPKTRRAERRNHGNMVYIRNCLEKDSF